MNKVERDKLSRMLLITQECHLFLNDEKESIVRIKPLMLKELLDYCDKLEEALKSISTMVYINDYDKDGKCIGVRYPRDVAIEALAEIK